jgi:uncharacterized protein
VGLACTFLLGIYGGFFSGGYVALLMATFVAFFHFTFIEAVALTQVLNMFHRWSPRWSLLGRGSLIGG